MKTTQTAMSALRTAADNAMDAVVRTEKITHRARLLDTCEAFAEAKLAAEEARLFAKLAAEEARLFAKLAQEAATDHCTPEETRRIPALWEMHVSTLVAADIAINAAEKAEEVIAGEPGATTAAEHIARETLGLSTLDTRNSDELDFHDISVWTLKEALEAAYIAGRASK